jgi:hypothetical protein
MEDIENHMKPMEVSPFTGSRYFILNGRDECFCIWNRYPSHWEHPYTSLLPVYLKARLSASIYGVTYRRGGAFPKGLRPFELSWLNDLLTMVDTHI